MYLLTSLRPPVPFQQHILPAQSQPTSLRVPWGHGSGSPCRQRKGWFLVGAAFLYQDSSLQTNWAGGNCLELDSWKKWLRDSQLCGFSATGGYRRVSSACSPRRSHQRGLLGEEPPLCHFTWQTQNAFAAACEAGISFHVINMLVCPKEGN